SKNKDAKCFGREAFVLDFAHSAPARDAVRCFCATFGSKSRIISRDESSRFSSLRLMSLLFFEAFCKKLHQKLLV
ncbi:MAG: hypothetical protein II323_06665, partial [Tidjanibacter sp.]|nr:hypothetical protein [Tidjanibacter sp.]